MLTCFLFYHNFLKKQVVTFLRIYEVNEEFFCLISLFFCVTIRMVLKDILNNETITNAMLKTIIDVIEVDDDSNVEVRLKLLNEIGSSPMVITNFDDIRNQYSTVTKSNNSTQRRK